MIQNCAFFIGAPFDFFMRSRNKYDSKKPDMTKNVSTDTVALFTIMKPG